MIDIFLIHEWQTSYWTEHLLSRLYLQTPLKTAETVLLFFGGFFAVCYRYYILSSIRYWNYYICVWEFHVAILNVEYAKWLFTCTITVNIHRGYAFRFDCYVERFVTHLWLNFHCTIQMKYAIILHTQSAWQVQTELK